MIPANVVYDPDTEELLVRVPVDGEGDVVLMRVAIAEGEGEPAESKVPASEKARLGRRL